MPPEKVVMKKQSKSTVTPTAALQPDEAQTKERSPGAGTRAMALPPEKVLLKKAKPDPSILPPPRLEKRTHPDLEMIPREEIACRAYELFLARGAIHGRDLEDWVQAEKESGLIQRG